MKEERYIDFGIAQYALAKVLWALWQNDIMEYWITLEDSDLHVRIKESYLERILYPRKGDCQTSSNGLPSDSEREKLINFIMGDEDDK